MTAGDRARWDATDYASKENLLRVVREEAEILLALAEQPECWESSTACGHWQVRDIVGHLVDVTEGYLERFALARAGGDAPEPYGLRVMAQRLDEGAQAFRGVPQATLVGRLRDDFNNVMALFDGLSADEWTGMLVVHPYMGPLPAFFYPVFHIMDYGVHGWDIREGLRQPNGLSGDVADFLVPFMFILWQATTDSARVGPEPLQLGIKVSGRSGGTWLVNVSQSGYTYESSTLEDMNLPVIFEFDPGSLVLTAFGRIRGGTAYGDRQFADKYRSLFFSI